MSGIPFPPSSELAKVGELANMMRLIRPINIYFILLPLRVPLLDTSDQVILPESVGRV